jgi:RHS repeat-associated protein
MKTSIRAAAACVAAALLSAALSAEAYYSPQTGRFASRDPIGDAGGLLMGGLDLDSEYSQNGVGDFNPFGFVHNDSVDFQDSLGLITVGFYGADTWFTFPNAGNVKMQEIASRLHAPLFDSLGVGYAYRYLLANAKCGEDIKIFGWSWGGVSAVKLARWIKDSSQFSNHSVSVVAVVDPVSKLRFPPWSVPDNVRYFWNRYETRGTGVRPINFHGGVLFSNAAVSDEADLNRDGSQTVLYFGRLVNVNHVTILWKVENDLVNLLK